MFIRQNQTQTTNHDNLTLPSTHQHNKQINQQTMLIKEILERKFKRIKYFQV